MSYYTLQVPADKQDPNKRPQFYRSNNIFGLVIQILQHRFWHWRRGDGWQD